MTNEYMFSDEYSIALYKHFLSLKPVMEQIRILNDRQNVIMPCGKKVKPPKK